ncbi:hypothetical protein L9S41_19270 [Geoalkalibacter halelectricus]|uniref:Transposase n=1 Tax=Geoalkalibacter halelectricus TaxID=2847045 RepID=A0ABY5ZPH6_9BACT|nr:hypothetical protein [Geoalkalibacter halelectricus]UWZ79790.1 hypothetical protein L9S41_19270 [Geoalkalibacter halelectricus]
MAEGAAALVGFCPTITQPWQEVRRLQRALDRSRRATNPHCFGPDGTWKKGTRQSVFSARYRNLKTRIAEAERRLASERKRSHGTPSAREEPNSNTVGTLYLRAIARTASLSLSEIMVNPPFALAVSSCGVKSLLLTSSLPFIAGNWD